MHEIRRNEFTYDVLDTDDMHIETCDLKGLLQAQKCGLDFYNMQWDLRQHEGAILSNNMKLINDDYSASVSVLGVLSSFNCPHLLWYIKDPVIQTEEFILVPNIVDRELKSVYVWYAGYMYIIKCEDEVLDINGFTLRASRDYMNIYSKLDVMGITTENILRLRLRDWFSYKNTLEFRFNTKGGCIYILNSMRGSIDGKPVSMKAFKKLLFNNSI